MKKILVGGTFSIIHPGHLFFLRKARELGDSLTVVVASDRTVLRTKGFLVMPAEARKKVVEALRAADRVVIGDERDFLKVVKKERPDVIALGYDQRIDERQLRSQLAKLGLECRIVRIRSSLKGYKTEEILRLLKGKKYKSNRGRKSGSFIG